MRKASFAGSFYPKNKEELKRIIEKCFHSEFGAKEIKKENIFGGIVPHAGYVYSGACATHVYSKLKKATFVIFGTNHTGLANECDVSLEDIETPFGIAKVNKELAKEIGTVNEIAHSYEHSIEVQIPFLQYFVKDFDFVPVIIGTHNLEKIKKIARKINGVCKNKNTIFLASSDFTHYGPNYNYIPFENAKENLKKIDKAAINKIKNLDSEGLLDHIYNTGATICGVGPILTLIELAKLNEIKIVKELCYYTSGEISGDYNNCVGYAAVIFK